MWRCIEQLVGKLRDGRSLRAAMPPRSTQLSIETLENRTVLSANFGVDYETLAYHDFSAPPTPRLFVDHEAAAALAAAFAEDAPAAFTEDRMPVEFAEDALFVIIISFRSNHQAIGDNNWGTSKPPLRSMWGGERASSSSAASSLEDAPLGLLGGGYKEPQRIQTPVDSNVDSGNNDKVALTSNFDPPQPTDLGTWLDRIVEARHVTTSPFLAPISGTTTSEEPEADDSASLLASSATLAT
jgi:hypothetical protein